MRTSVKVFGVDANVLLRYLARDNAELSAKAKLIFDSMDEGDIAITCDPVTLAETIWVLESYYKVSAQDVVARLTTLLECEGFRMPDKDVYLAALQLYAGPAHNFGDACACAMARAKCGGALLSFDRQLSHIEGISRFETPAEV